MTETRLLGGRYQIGELLGYGGMAEVHRGRDERLGRDVAVKVLRADLARDSQFQARFRREAQNAASLNHPSIVAVYDTGEEATPEGTLPFIVMEFVEGRTLKEVLTAEGRIMPQRAMEIVADVCSALDFSHRNGIVHRDIKPANVMLTKTGAVKVMDFGIARALAAGTSTMTQTSAVIGTAQYLSPEQARGEAVDARSDVYSTGCLLYELLVGHPPFTGDNPVSVAYQHVRENPIPPSEINRDVGATMDSVVLKAMAKNPINRYQSAAEMRADLLRAAAGRPVDAPTVLTAEERTAVLPRAGATSVLPGAYDDQPPDDEKKTSKAVTWILAILALIAIFAVAAFATSQFLRSNAPEVTVPSVIGNDYPEAQDKLEDLGFSVSKQVKASTNENKDKVIEQNPKANTEVEKGSRVILVVGGGPDTATVPDLDGLDKAGVESQLDAAGLKGDFETVASSKPQNQVVSYSPGKGSVISTETAVRVKISDGSLKVVPQVVGLEYSAAVAELNSRGFNFNIQYETSNRRKDTVVRQDPGQNSEVPAGSIVTLYVAQEPEPSPSTTRPTTPTPTSTTTPPSPTVTLGAGNRRD